MRSRGLIILLPLLLCGGCNKKKTPAAPPEPLAAPAPIPRLEPIRRLPALTVPAPRPGTLLGGELGLDHVAIAVRDLEAARKSYGKLGFASPSAGKLPNGIQNVNYYFKDTTYLETMNAWDPKKVPWLAGFTSKHEGAYFLALCIRSAEETAAFLERRGLPTLPPKPGTIQVTGVEGAPKELWKTLFFKTTPFPDGTLFFIAYSQKVRETLFERLRERRIRLRYFSHPNTALGVQAVWMAVKSADKVLRWFSSAGFAPGRTVEHAFLGARGRVVPAGIGSIIVLEPSHPKSPLAAFLASRGEGLFGLTIQVSHPEVAAALIEKNTGRIFRPGPGFFGPSLLLPPELTHGAWMEMVR